jgi:hypothetical protein
VTNVMCLVELVFWLIWKAQLVFLVADEYTGISKQDPLQRMINSFIVKIWLTNPEGRDSDEWRGHITHVSTQERRYFQSLEDIMEFIKPFLERMGVRVASGSRLKRWLRRKPMMHRGFPEGQGQSSADKTSGTNPKNLKEEER